MNKRRRMVGKVTSNKMMKTVVVEIVRKYRHPLYQKVVYSSSRVKAHDEHELPDRRPGSDRRIRAAFHATSAGWSRRSSGARSVLRMQASRLWLRPTFLWRPRRLATTEEQPS